MLSRGRIDLFQDAVLGMGSYGTAIFRGSFDGRTVAVKRPLLDFVTLISRDVSTLRAAGGHPNVVQYYDHETDYDFLYIALDLCPATLADVFARPDEFREVVDTLALETQDTLRQITAGLHHLHTLDIIHRDNAGPRPGLRWLLSDFGIRKKYDHNRKRLRLPKLNDMLDPTDGWCAPEVIREKLEYEDPKIPREWLVESSGNGDRALGCRWRRLEGLEELGSYGEVGRALIKRMLSHESCERPDTGTCLMHPYFWDDGQRWTFLLTTSERSGAMSQDAVGTLEQHVHEALSVDQLSQLDELFMEHLDEFIKYDGKPLQEQRDSRNHLRDQAVAYDDAKGL
ncbi:hypothetical protein V8D89_000037 [Ganoderma adspersum]